MGGLLFGAIAGSRGSNSQGGSQGGVLGPAVGTLRGGAGPGGPGGCSGGARPGAGERPGAHPAPGDAIWTQRQQPLQRQCWRESSQTFCWEHKTQFQSACLTFRVTPQTEQIHGCVHFLATWKHKFPAPSDAGNSSIALTHKIPALVRCRGGRLQKLDGQRYGWCSSKQKLT